MHRKSCFQKIHNSANRPLFGRTANEKLRYGRFSWLDQGHKNEIWKEKSMAGLERFPKSFPSAAKSIPVYLSFLKISIGHRHLPT